MSIAGMLPFSLGGLIQSGPGRMAWVVTLPVAGALGALFALALPRVM